MKIWEANMPKLIITFQDVLIKEHHLGKAIETIGRKEDNDIFIDNAAVSGRHAKIENKDGNFVITDLGSTNGTFVNGKRVNATVLKRNDFINVGKHILYFK